MRVRIHYTIGGYEDAIDITGEDNKEIREKADAELLRRGIKSDPESLDKHNIWSEDIA